MNYSPVKCEVATSIGIGDLFTIKDIIRTIGPYDIDLWVKVTWDLALNALHYVNYTPVGLNMLHPMVKEDLDLQVIFYCDHVTWNVAQYPPHYVNYAPVNVKVATPNCQGDAFKIHYLTFDLDGHIKCCPVPSTLFDLCTCKVLICYVPQFRWCICKKCDRRMQTQDNRMTHRQTDLLTDDYPTLVWN